MIEKPDVETARRRLRTGGLPDGHFLAHAGVYAFGPEIFDCLAELHASTPTGAELGLTEAQELLLTRRPEEYFLCAVDGMVLDTGTPEGYVRTLRRLLKT